MHGAQASHSGVLTGQGGSLQGVRPVRRLCAQKPVLRGGDAHPLRAVRPAPLHHHHRRAPPLGPGALGRAAAHGPRGGPRPGRPSGVPGAARVRELKAAMQPLGGCRGDERVGLRQQPRRPLVKQAGGRAEAGRVRARRVTDPAQAAGCPMCASSEPGKSVLVLGVGAARRVCPGQA